MLLFENIRKYYNGFLALEIPSLIIENGLWWLQGENGSGKTTFLKTIAGLHPFDGNLVLQERFTLRKQRQQYLRLINYAEAEPLYPPFLTAKDLVNLYCYTKEGAVDDVRHMLKQLHIYEAYDERIGNYSTGMVKKLSLALAFIGKPKLILLDEPLITIDANAIDTISGIIKEKFKEGVSFIISSHQVVTADQLHFAGTLHAQNRTITKQVNDLCNQDITKSIS